MLLLYTRLHVSMFIILSLYQVLASYKPIRSRPINNEIVIKEGEMLIIKCMGDTPLQLIYPNIAEEPINSSKYYTHYYMKNGRYEYTFDKSKTVFGDTGWYSCVNRNFDSLMNSYDFDSSPNSYDGETDWLYVYVKSDTNLFVEAHTKVNLHAVIDGSVVIPCRTTSPDLKPILINGNEDILNEVPFDPKIGFTIRNLSLEDNNSYKCLIEKDGEKHTVSYVLSVLKEALSKLRIQVNNLFVAFEQDLIMNCTVEMELFKDCEFDWKMPQEDDSRRNIQQFIEHLDGNVLVTSQLTIFNVTYKDEGNYKCVVSTPYEITQRTKKMWIYSPDIKLIEFLYNFNSSYIRQESGNSFQLDVFVYTSLETYIQWFKPNGEAIVGDSENIVIIEQYNPHNIKNLDDAKTVSSLKIISLNVTHSGNYILRANNGYTMKKINFTLDVIDEPISKLMYIRSYYTLNKSTEFHCEITSNPPPNVKWSFLKCPNYPSVENSTIVYLMNATQSAAYNSSYRFESTVKMSIEMSGKITCEACNDLGCDSKTENIIVSVPIPPYFIKTNMNKTKTKTIDVAESSNTVILRCFAEGIPKPTITWYKDNILLKENNQYIFLHNRQELHVKYLMLNDSGKYLCQANNSMGTNETYQQITVKNSKWNTLDIVLVTSISSLGFILIILAIYFTIKIHREKKIRKELMEAGLLNFEEGTLESLNPNLTVDEQAELLPYDKKWEFPRERLKLKEQLDSGQFGVVMKAEAIGICKNESVTTVAVKMVRTINPTYIHALVSELKIMVHLGKHLNVLNLLGACTKNISKCELLVIVEYCHFGNLRNYLLRHRNYFVNQINSKAGKFDVTVGKDMLTRTIIVNNDSLNANSHTDMMVHYCLKTNPNSSEINFLSDCILNSNSCQSEEKLNHCDKDENLKPICTQDLLSWAFQVARGMEYLSQRKVLHGDLAARNILLAEDNIVKICDFGLAKDIFKDGNYKKKSDGPVPVKWMAIESIRDRIFSTQSDVWSFGIMLWEFFTLAKTPYPDMEVKEQYQKLIKGYRLEQPNYAVDEIYDIMLQCWLAKPTLRPSFSDLVGSIGNLLEENVRMHYIILNNPYVDINMMNFKNGKDDYLMMMSAPDHTVLSDYKRMNSFSKEFSLISHKDHSNIELSSSTSDSENVIDLPPMKYEEDSYLKPINFQERRAEFARQREAMKNKMIDNLIDQTSTYYNVPQKSLHISE